MGVIASTIPSAPYLQIHKAGFWMTAALYQIGVPLFAPTVTTARGSHLSPPPFLTCHHLLSCGYTPKHPQDQGCWGLPLTGDFSARCNPRAVLQVPTMLLQCVAPKQRGALMGLDEAMNTLARVIAPIAVGGLYATHGALACCGTAGCAVLFAALVAACRRWIVLRGLYK